MPSAYDVITIGGDFVHGFTAQLGLSATWEQLGQLLKALRTAEQTGLISCLRRDDDYGPHRFTLNPPVLYNALHLSLEADAEEVRKQLHKWIAMVMVQP